ncbi:hypothetical protein [Nannocystis sp.]|uniref:hypothetical protein n=1 Tax=Nannocystis sp. TaxID=1962667 RepID=UPI002426CCBD|nr:hypothetical protein [Nannocystis sp.]MBK7830399.1 hypothetical protein [Nannocystis sp.]MBK9752370.1 hypothetical protein [Nannocystis sp.]
MERYRSFGCGVAVAHGPVGPERRRQLLIYVAATAQAAAGLRAAEKPMLEPAVTPRDQAFYTRELGLRLGYPECCVAAFAAQVRAGHPRSAARQPHPDYLHARLAWTPRPDWRLNCLLLRQHARLVSFAACRFDCPAALAQAEALRALLAQHAPAELPVLEAMLRRPLAIERDGGRAWVVVEDGRVSQAEAPCEAEAGPAPGGRVSQAEAPGEPRSGAAQAADELAARSFLAAELAADGSLRGRGAPPPICIDFSGGSAAGGP